MSKQYAHYSVSDFDHFDCLKLSNGIYLMLAFVLRGYIIWIMSVTNMRDHIGVIQELYPEPALFYLSLASGTVGLFMVLIISLRRPGAPDWIRRVWQHCRALMVTTLLFDFVISLAGYVFWSLLSLNWLILQGGLVCLFIAFCFHSRRFTLNLQEFPEKIATV